ncbi:Gfo/Idh/MocA family oxidoreductase [Aeromicrobium sp.]|uniref:Gfo/Idh/MocA family protein n=1 Tax=Aeromicrobium sp. TaxID=1871063 RepID=UPI0019C3C730|nr:Gfo/Idh/MocA family oxidoreductase [Aeromicrobium sp.]MBC7632445.1 Gfo/Idh/MocA family oxidoreductase [Aeromicrobium sp.]
MSGFATLPDSSTPVRVIQVGAGGMGKVWLELLVAAADVDLVGLVDLDVDLARRALTELGIDGVIVGTSVTDVAAQVDAQAVVNVTVPVAHHPVTTEALFLGLPVLSEKPIAPTVAQALSLAAAAETTGRLLMTSQSRRYYRSLQEFRQQVRSIGQVGILTTEFFVAPRFGGFRDEMPYPLLVDMAIHPFDVARYLLGANPVSVYCESFSPPWSWYAGDAATTAIFEFADGTRYTFTGSWCSGGLETSWNGSWRASGSDGTATWNGEDSPLAAGFAENATTPAIVGTDAAGPEVIAGALAEFVAALRTGESPSGEVHSNVFSLAMVEAAVRSAETGARVAIAEVLESALVSAIVHERRADVRSCLESWGSAAGHLGT